MVKRAFVLSDMEFDGWVGALAASGCLSAWSFFFS
jgi:hypothetical protein